MQNFGARRGKLRKTNVNCNFPIFMFLYLTFFKFERRVSRHVRETRMMDFFRMIILVFTSIILKTRMTLFLNSAFLTLFRERQPPNGGCREPNLAEYDFVILVIRMIILVPHEHAWTRRTKVVGTRLAMPDLSARIDTAGGAGDSRSKSSL